MASSYEIPKLELVIGYGYKYLAELPDKSFDVIITDSNDPKGLAVCLFQQPYYELLEKKLTKSRIICCQAKRIWFDFEFITNLLAMNRKIFKKVAYASTMICTYPSGQISFLICGKDPDVDLTKPAHRLDEVNLDLKYYPEQIHQSVFVLPKFVQLNDDKNVRRNEQSHNDSIYRHGSTKSCYSSSMKSK